MKTAKKLGFQIASTLAVFSLVFAHGTMTVSAEAPTSTTGLSVGIAEIISPVAPLGSDEDYYAYAGLYSAQDEVTEPEQEESTLVMADVSHTLNVRLEPDENSTKVGVLYKDCGGRILERKDGWTKLQSGDVVGWAADEYLLFDDKATELASNVGVAVAIINSEALNLRAEADDNAEVVAVVTQGTAIDKIEDLDGGWTKVSYNDTDCFVKTEFIKNEFRIDSGETMAAIKKREEEEAERKLKANRGAVVANADEARLLAALVYCESGNQPAEGKLGVAAVVMNRVRSGAYPNTISGVIYASGQFTPALNGSVARVYNGNIPDSCIQAANQALAGETTVGGACHFRRADGREGIVIGGHVFY